MFVVSKSDQHNTVNIEIRDKSVKQVKEIYYIGSLITGNNRLTKEVKRRIVPAKQAFEKKRFLLLNKNLSIKTKKCFIKLYIWSIFLHEYET